MNQAALALPEPARDEQAVRLLLGDCLDVLKTLPDVSVDAVVTDPPYALTANKKGGSGAKSDNPHSPAGRARIGTGNGAGGFMGKKWDSELPSIEVWQEALRVTKPGGYLLAFGGTRTSHRLAYAIEDAGWEIRDSIHWVYGQGFPKSLNCGDGLGTALKPAHEPIIMARKPLIGTVAQNLLAHGCGALNIDASRVGTTKRVPGSLSTKKNAVYGAGLGGYWQDGSESGHNPNIGRFPANLIHDGSPEVVALFPQTTPSPSKPITGVHKRRHDTGCAIKPELREVQGIGYGDQGSAARFFQSCPPDPEPDPLVYCAKASRADRDAGLDQFEEQRRGLMEDDAYQWQHDGRGHQYQRDTRRKNTHPTVKPTSLMRYLCRLITPPGGVCLDPFMGSGSTGKAAVMEGFCFIGIEREPEYLEIARARIAAAQSAMIL